MWYKSYMIEIDEVHAALMSPNTASGDILSYEYSKMLDLITKPQLSISEQRRMDRSIGGLNRNLGNMTVYLADYPDEADLIGIYNNVCSQVNALLGEEKLEPIDLSDKWVGDNYSHKYLAA
jgi:hypothetical protein